MTTLRTLSIWRRRVDASAAPSQLDIIAEVNARAARQHRGRLARQWAAAGTAVLLTAALWWLTQVGAARAPTPPAASAKAAAEGRHDRSAIGPSATGAGVIGMAGAEAAAALTPNALDEPASAEAAAAVVSAASAAEDQAHRARGRREADARAATAHGQQERLRAGLQERQQREAESEPQRVREMADATLRRATEQPPSRIPMAQEPARGVGERCLASSNIIAVFICHSRECRKPEQANDVLCTRLREIEEARRPSGQ